MLNNREKLFNQKKMASLQELESKFQKIKSELPGYESKLNDYSEKLKKQKVSLDELDGEIADLEQGIKDAEGTIGSKVASDVFKKAAEQEKARLMPILAQKRQERKDLEALMQGKEQAEIDVESAKKEMHSIIQQFASDPRINQHLREAIELKYSKEIGELKDKKTRKEKTRDDLADALQNDPKLQELVSKFVTSYSEVKNLPIIIESEEDKKKASSARGKLTRNQNALKAAIKANGITVTLEDLEALVDGNYKLPSLDAEVRKLDVAIASLESKKEKILQDISRGVSTNMRIDPNEVARLQTAIAGQEQIVTDNEAKMQAEEQEIAKIDQEITTIQSKSPLVDTKKEEQELSAAQDAEKAILDGITARQAEEQKLANAQGQIKLQLAAAGLDQKKLDNLTKKAGVPAELLADRDEAQKEYNEALQKLRKKGYISKETFDLKACEKEFQAFRDADLAVRKAFLECQTSDSKDAKTKLQKAMEDYQKASAALLAVKGMEGLTVENWHDYLVRTLNREARDGELDEAYYDQTMEGKLSNIRTDYGKTFKNHPDALDSKYDAVVDASKKIRQLQEDFLKGKDVKFTDVEKDIDGYHTSFKGLFDTLKNKGAEGLSKISDLFNSLKGKIVKLGFFARIKNFFTRDKSPKKVSGTKTKTEAQEILELRDELRTKKDELDVITSEIEDEYIGKNLTESEAKELREQQDKKAKVTTLTSKKTLIDSRIALIKPEIAALQGKLPAAKQLVADKQKTLNDAKAAGTLSPEDQNKLKALNAKKQTHVSARTAAQTAIDAAKQEQARLEAEKAGLSPTKLDTSVENGWMINHGEGQALKDVTLQEFGIDRD